MIVFTTQSRMDAAKLYLTKERMQLIMDAMDRYVAQYGHLPCPVLITMSKTDNSYGIDSIEDGNCTDGSITVLLDDSGSRYLLGAFPYKSLGLEPQDIVDGWGMRFDYILTEKYTDPANYTDPDAEFGKSYTINNISDTNIAEDVDVAYIMISHGPNVFGGYRDKDGARVPGAGSGSSAVAEGDNADDNRGFYTYPQTSTFDDILIYKPRWQLPKYIN